MIQFEHLSFWEKKQIIEGIHFTVVGGGIVGSACAIKLRELYPQSKIVLLERGYLSTGASTKNAGFACFGSLTEIFDDLKNSSDTEVWDTVALRYDGLKRLEERFSRDGIHLKTRGSWDLIDQNEPMLQDYQEQIPKFNAEIKRITGKSNCFSFDSTIHKKLNFNQLAGGFYNALEGEIDTGCLLLETNLLLAKNKIIVLNGINVISVEKMADSVILHTNFGDLKSAKVGITINGFAKQIYPELEVHPARAQVLVTEKIKDFDLPGTFHYDKGYFYFRAIDNRLLIGGGRNIDFKAEESTELVTTKQITTGIKNLIETVLFPKKEVKIEYEWAGIMGVGPVKKPIIKKIDEHIGIGVRMGGMGVAIGSVVGEQLAEIL